MQLTPVQSLLLVHVLTQGSDPASTLIPKHTNTNSFECLKYISKGNILALEIQYASCTKCIIWPSCSLFCLCQREHRCVFSPMRTSTKTNSQGRTNLTVLSLYSVCFTEGKKKTGWSPRNLISHFTCSVL